MTLMCGDRWLETGNPFVGDDMSESQIEWLKAENARLMKENEQLMKDVHRIDAARQSAVSQVQDNRLLVSALHWLHMLKF